MQPTTGGLLRRQMDVEDYLAILRRNVGWVVGPVMAGVTIAVVVAMFWPDTYVSTAKIRIVPQQVPERLVQTNVNTDMMSRVEAMAQTIMSRSNLTNLINSNDLYRKELASKTLEDVILKMQSDISIHPIGTAMVGGRGSAVFEVSFAYENRFIAQRITNELMSKLIDDNMTDRASTSQTVTRFLKAQFEQAQAELKTAEDKLQDFKLANAGRLPDEMQGNMNQMQALESRIALINSDISRIEQQKGLLEANLKTANERLKLLMNPVSGPAAAAAAGGPKGAAGNTALAQKDAQIQQMQSVLDRMLEQYTPAYPDVKTVQQRLQTLKKEREDLLNGQLTIQQPEDHPEVAAPVQQRGPTPEQARAIVDVRGQIDDIRAKLKASDMETDNAISQLNTQRNRLKMLTDRVAGGPTGSAELDALERERDAARQNFDHLRAQLTNSETATELETTKQGETLEVLENPLLPTRPTYPNRPLIIIAGAMVGLFVGGAAVVFMELKNTSLRTLKDVRAYTQFNVLGSVPLLENDLIVRRRKRVSMLAWSTATVLSVAAMTASVYFYEALH